MERKMDDIIFQIQTHLKKYKAYSAGTVKYYAQIHLQVW